MTGAFQHLCDSGFRWEHDRKSIGPLLFKEEAVKILGGIRWYQPWGRVFNKSLFLVFLAQRNRQCLDDLLQHGFARYRVIPLQVFAARFRRCTGDGVRYKSEALIGHSSFEGVILHEIAEGSGYYGCSGDSKFLDCQTMADDRRRAGASMSHSHDHAAPFFFDFGPQLGIVFKIGPDFGFDDKGCIWIFFAQQFLHFRK